MDFFGIGRLYFSPWGRCPLKFLHGVISGVMTSVIYMRYQAIISSENCHFKTAQLRMFNYGWRWLLCTAGAVVGPE